jgi:hypothetical protein
MLCRNCNVEMKPGKAMIPVYGKGLPDFVDDAVDEVLPGDTISPVGSAYTAIVSSVPNADTRSRILCCGRAERSSS